MRASVGKELPATRQALNNALVRFRRARGTDTPPTEVGMEAVSTTRSMSSILLSSTTARHTCSRLDRCRSELISSEPLKSFGRRPREGKNGRHINYDESHEGINHVDHETPTRCPCARRGNNCFHLWFYNGCGSWREKKPLHQVAHQEMLVDWFDFWLNGHEDPDSTKSSQYARWRTLKQLPAIPENAVVQ
jgi:hypothetical protein